MRTDSTPSIEATGISRRFGGVVALDSVTLGIPRGEFFSLLGPSGCGKTTLLRIIAGLDAPDSGSLRLGGRDALPIPAHQRPVNTVFQSYALFPHLSVRNNVAFGLRMKNYPKADIESRVRTFMELTRIADLSARKPTELSGGQRQRVALARALINEPEVLLLDEPLAALDLKLRKELQGELRSLQRRTGTTFIYVTHDQDEALSLSDRIAVMDRGRVIQLGRGEELYERPRNRFVAQFLGGCNLIAARVRQRSGNDVVADTAVGEMRFSTPDTRPDLTLAIRPEKIHVGRGEINQCSARVTETIYTGAETQCVVRVDGEVLRVVSVNADSHLRLKPGDEIRITLPPEALTVLED